MKKISNRHLQEVMYYEKLKNGLDVFIWPKKDYNKTCAIYSVKYGSIDNCFSSKISSKCQKTPSGIAHFLEHKLFAMEDGSDALNKFSEYGANANAFTTYNRTSYLFSTTNNFLECLNLLISFVEKPFFTKENVDKEKGIIKQEIQMYRDYPDWYAENGVIQNMYSKNSVRDDILGDVKSINKIDENILQHCYDSFYHPQNMQLFIIGNCDEKVIENIKSKEIANDFILKRKYCNDKKPPIKEKIQYLNVLMPKVAFGIKMQKQKMSGKKQLKYELTMGIFLALLFSESSYIYQDLLDRQLINEGFDVYANHEISFDFIIFEGDTNKPYELRDEIKNIIKNLPEVIFLNEDFLRMKKAIIGKYISSFNSLEGIATAFTRYSFMKMNFFSIIPTLNDITIEDINNLKPLFNEEYFTSYIVLPNDMKNEIND